MRFRNNSLLGDNSLSPTKGWGPFRRDVKSDYYVPSHFRETFLYVQSLANSVSTRFAKMFLSIDYKNSSILGANTLPHV